MLRGLLTIFWNSENEKEIEKDGWGNFAFLAQQPKSAWLIIQNMASPLGQLLFSEEI